MRWKSWVMRRTAGPVPGSGAAGRSVPDGEPLGRSASPAAARGQAWRRSEPGRGDASRPPFTRLDGRPQPPSESESAASEVRAQPRRRGVETDDVEDPRVLRYAPNGH